MIGGQDEDSCGKSGTSETPQERPRKAKSCTEIHNALCPNLVLHICHQ
ncbi:hypothetical protein P4689_19130 [Priestia megaterium]|nr:hypothetical protein [Priestia megaterium]